MTDLKPCPFCGGSVYINYDAGGVPSGVVCMECKTITTFFRIRNHAGTETFGETYDKILAAWNRRDKA